MKKGCVILAAGRNSRLDTGKPKSLLKINNQTLLERHINLFSQSGVDCFCIVTGYQSEKIVAEAERLANIYKVNIQTVYNAKFDLENGYSVWMARNWIVENQVGAFYLTMADHVFHPGFIQDFLNNKEFSKETLHLAVDKPGMSNAHIDIEDVTKVLATEDFIKDIGKHLTTYNFFDTGLFHLKSDIMKAFEANFDQGMFSISNTVQSLALEKEAKIVDVTGYPWNDVDNPEDYNKSKDLDLN